MECCNTTTPISELQISKSFLLICYVNIDYNSIFRYCSIYAKIHRKQVSWVSPCKRIIKQIVAIGFGKCMITIAGTVTKWSPNLYYLLLFLKWTLDITYLFVAGNYPEFHPVKGGRGGWLIKNELARFEPANTSVLVWCSTDTTTHHP